MHLAHQPDTRPHSSIQTWSRGAVFPAVIKRVETYYDSMGTRPHEPLAKRLMGTKWVVILNGQTTAHDSYDEAYAYAEQAVQRSEATSKHLPHDLRARDSDGHLLEAGALYCERHTDYYAEGESRYGRLMWYGGVGRRFFDADSEEEVIPDGDALVRQNVALNVGYIS